MKKFLVSLCLLLMLSTSAFAGIGYSVDFTAFSFDGKEVQYFDIEPTIGYYQNGWGIGAWIGIGQVVGGPGETIVEPGWFLSRSIFKTENTNTSLSIGHPVRDVPLGCSIEHTRSLAPGYDLMSRVSWADVSDIVQADCTYMLGLRRFW